VSAETTSLAQVSGVGLLRVPKSPAADFQDSPSNVLPFPSELDLKEYRQFTLPTGETIPLSGFKALYLQSLLSTSRENPLLDNDARSILRKPGEDTTPKKLQKRLLQARWQLNEMFDAYGIRYTVTECFHEVSPGELQRAKYLRHLDTVEPDGMEERTNTSSLPTNEAERSVPSITSETPTAPLPQLEDEDVASENSLVEDVSQIAEETPATETYSPTEKEDASPYEQVTEQPHQEEEDALLPEDLPSAEIKDPIERRVESRSSGRPKLVLDQAPESPGKVTARIQIPGRGRTRGLQLSTDEAILLRTLFTSPASYTHGRLELTMVDIARSDAFDKFGGFERVFNSLNRKLGAWRMTIGLDENNRFVFVNASGKLLTLTPIYRNLDKDFENSGLGERQRRRQPSHGKQKL